MDTILREKVLERAALITNRRAELYKDKKKFERSYAADEDKELYTLMSNIAKGIILKIGKDGIYKIPQGATFKIIDGSVKCRKYKHKHFWDMDYFNRYRTESLPEFDMFLTEARKLYEEGGFQKLEVEGFKVEMHIEDVWILHDETGAKKITLSYLTFKEGSIGTSEWMIGLDDMLDDDRVYEAGIRLMKEADQKYSEIQARIKEFHSKIMELVKKHNLLQYAVVAGI